MSRKKGFTLVELLVVISIIALLLSLLLPALKRAKNQAKNVLCMSNLKNWGLAVQCYASENNGQIMGFTVGGGWGLGNFECLGKYLQGTSVYTNILTASVMRCPRAMELSPSSLSPFGSSKSGWHGGYKFGYGVNQHTSNPTQANCYGGGQQPPWWTCDDYWRKMADLGNNSLATIPAISDAAWGIIWADDRFPPPATKDAYPTAYPGTSANWFTNDMICIDRHDGSINAVFLDASARKVGLKEIWTLKWHRSTNTTGRWTKAGGVKPEDWPEWMRKYKDY